MRIISGKYRGRKLLSPLDESVRPTTDRVKENIFNVLQFNVNEATVLDLFSGSGALGIECLSRGAKYVLFCDKATESIDLLKKNLSEISGNYDIAKTDYLACITSLGKKKFDIVFIDAPYHTSDGAIAVEVVLRKDMLADNGVLVYEHDATVVLQCDLPHDIILNSRKYGHTVVDFLTKVRYEK